MMDLYPLDYISTYVILSIFQQASMRDADALHQHQHQHQHHWSRLLVTSYRLRCHSLLLTSSSLRSAWNVLLCAWPPIGRISSRFPRAIHLPIRHYLTESRPIMVSACL